MALPINKQCFLTAAEELNFSKAAKKLYMSQQCLSQHIKKLETEYNTSLFIRKPVLKLTPVGKMLYEEFNKLAFIENNINTAIHEADTEVKVISIGMHPSRARLIIPDFLRKYPDSLKQVVLKVVEDMPAQFEKNIDTGKLDMFISLNPILNPAHKTELLLNEGVSLIVSDKLLRKYFAGSCQQILKQSFLDTDLSLFAELPFIINNGISPFSTTLQAYLQQKGVLLRHILEINGNNIHLELCQTGIGACFLPTMYNPLIAQLNRAKPEPEKLHIFQLSELHNINRLCLVYNNQLYLTKTQTAFVKLLKKYFAELALEINNMPN